MRRPSGEMSKALGVGVGARQLVARALEQVAHAAAVGVQQVQVRHAAHRQVVVPVAVLRLAGGVAAFLALLEGLVRRGLRLGALAARARPRTRRRCAGRRGTSGRPRRRWRTLAARARLAAVGRDQVELRRLVLARPAARAWRRRRCGRRAGSSAAGRPCRRSASAARGAPPSVDSSHSVLAALLSSIEWRVSAATACAPSGARLGVPRRSICHRSSMVSGFFWWACGRWSARCGRSWQSQVATHRRPLGRGDAVDGGVAQAAVGACAGAQRSMPSSCAPRRSMARRLCVLSGACGTPPRCSPAPRRHGAAACHLHSVFSGAALHARARTRCCRSRRAGAPGRCSCRSSCPPARRRRRAP